MTGRQVVSSGWFLAAVGVVALAVVGAVVGGRQGGQGVEADVSREAFCVGMDLEIDAVIATFADPDLDEQGRETAVSTAGMLFSPAFVAGAPDHLAAAAGALRDDVLALATEVPDTEQRDAIVSEHAAVQQASRDVCPDRPG